MLRHPLVWHGDGWWCTRHFDRPDALWLPPQWPRARLFLVRCSVGWLLHNNSLNLLRQFDQLRHLEVEGAKLDEQSCDVTPETIRQALSSLRLQTLILPYWEEHMKRVAHSLRRYGPHCRSRRSKVNHRCWPRGRRV